MAAVIATTALAASMLGAGTATAAPSPSPSASTGASPIASWDGNVLVVDRTKTAALLKSTFQVVKGSRSSLDGGCDFQSPALELGPGQTAIGYQQVKIDLDACEATYEIGEPADLAAFLPSETADSRLTEQGAVSQSVATPMAAQVSSGYNKHWLTDVVNLTVNSVQANVAWTWTGSCVTSRSGSTDWYWRSGSGWEPPNPKSSLYTDGGCAWKGLDGSATYRNQGFCWPSTVYAYYNPVSVRGNANGVLVGSHNTSHTGTCLWLIDHDALVRTAN